MPNVVEKTGAQRAAEATVEGFKEELGPFVVAAETTRMPMAFTDARVANHPIIFVNEAFRTLSGYEEHEMLGQGFDFLMEQGADPEALAEIRTAFSGGRDLEPQLRYRRKDGSMFWVQLFICPVHDAAGTVVQHFASFVDITRSKVEEDRLHLLVDEMNHRTQNTLATVLAITDQTLTGHLSGALLGDFRGRIMALATTQSLLGRASWDQVGLAELIKAILEPFGVEDARIGRIDLRGGDFGLQPKAALTLAMVFQELASNAAKHGALSNELGRVDVAWRVEMSEAGDQLLLEWRESDGPPVERPTHAGFGTRLLGPGLARELDGSVNLDYRRSGVMFRMTMPLPSLAPQ